MKRTVALIRGGEGFEHNISILSAENLASLIDNSEYFVISVLITKNGEWYIEADGEKTPTFPVFLNGKSGLFANGKIIPIDVAIPALHGDFGEDGIITGALKASHMKFIGCDVLAGAVCADKIVTKMIADALKIPTTKWTFFTDRDTNEAKAETEKSLSYPLFIKPAALGSSIGISKVTESSDFNLAYEKARKTCPRILIEEAADVECEFECAYLGENGKDRFAVGKILSDGSFYDFDKKYGGSTKTQTGIELSKITDSIIESTSKLKNAISVAGLARFDFFLTKSGEILFNEINTFPGMTPTSLYPQLTVDMGLKAGEFINRLIAEALI